MNTYTASYDKSHGWGAYQHHEYLIVANTESEALGFALEAETDTDKLYWTIRQIDISKIGTTHIISLGS